MKVYQFIINIGKFIILIWFAAWAFIGLWMGGCIGAQSIIEILTAALNIPIAGPYLWPR
jgi:hypothetical protein